MYNPSPGFLKLVSELARRALESGRGLKYIVEVSISKEELQSFTPEERGFIEKHVVSSSDQEVVIRVSVKNLVDAGLLKLVKKSVLWAPERRRLLWFWALGDKVLDPYEFENLYNLDRRTLKTLAYVLGVVDLYHELKDWILEIWSREGSVIIEYDDILFDANFHENTIKAMYSKPRLDLEARIKKVTRLEPVTWLKSVDVYWAMCFIKEALEGEVAKFADFVEREMGLVPYVGVVLKVELHDNDVYHGADYDVVEYEIKATDSLKEGVKVPAILKFTYDVPAKTMSVEFEAEIESDILYEAFKWILEHDRETFIKLLPSGCTVDVSKEDTVALRFQWEYHVEEGFPSISRHYEDAKRACSILRDIISKYIEAIKEHVVVKVDGKRYTLAEILERVKWDPKEPREALARKLIVITRTIEKPYGTILAAKLILEALSENKAG